jgi:hypothetical protein
VTGLEERSDGLIARVAPAAAVEVDERRERHQRARGADRQDLDAVRVRHRDGAVARPEVDAVRDRNWRWDHNGTIYVGLFRVFWAHAVS